MAKSVDLERLLEDLKEVNKQILRIVNPNDKIHIPNWEVIKHIYIYPSIVTQILSLDNPDGMYCYFRKIRGVLEYAIANGSIPGEMVSFEAPDYFMDLIK